MSPEQLTAEPVSDRADVYGLGLVAYELLTGDSPFGATSPMQMMAAHLRDAPERLSARRPDVDPELEELVLACLVKEPSARPSAADIVRRLGSSEVALEWPAPGLGWLQGTLSAPTRLLAAGGVFMAGGVLALLDAGASLVAPRGSLLALSLVLLAAAGAAAFAVAVWRFGRLARQVAHAVGAGYGWMTIAETVADTRRDTGRLIVGLREYASLTVAQRDALRRGRVLAATIGFGAAIAPLPLVLTSMAILEGESGTGLALLTTFGPTLALLLAAVAIRRREAQRLRAARARIARQPAPQDISSALVDAWRTALERASTGQRSPGGRTGRGVLAQAAAMLLAIVAAGTVLSLVPVFFLALFGARLWDLPSSSQTEAKLSIAETARPLVLASDPTILPLDAGRALWLLQLRPGESSRTRSGFVENDAVGPPELIPAQGYPASAFASRVRTPDGAEVDMREAWWAGPNPYGLLPYAHRGLSAEERRWLEQLDASPRWELWRRFLRAPRADIVGARFVLPFADSLGPSGLPIATVPHLKAMAYAGIGRAALYRARHERARGDTALREIITFGFKLVDNSSNLTELLVGIVMVGIGQGGLHDAFVLDGRPEGREYLERARVVQARDLSRDDPLAPTGAEDLDPRALRRRTVAIASDERVARGVRLLNYGHLANAPCTNVRELLTGPGSDVRAAMARSRATLARFPAEDQLLELIARSSTVPQPSGRIAGIGAAQRTAWGILYGLSRWSGWILRNPRIPACVSTARDVFWYWGVLNR